MRSEVLDLMRRHGCFQGLEDDALVEIAEHMEDDEDGECQSRKGNENLAAEGGEDVSEESDHEQRARRTASFICTPLSSIAQVSDRKTRTHAGAAVAAHPAT